MLWVPFRFQHWVSTVESYTTGWRYPGTVSSENNGTSSDWTGPNAVKTNDGGSNTDTVGNAYAPLWSASPTDFLRCTNFGFSSDGISDTATLIGCEVEVRHGKYAGAGNTVIYQTVQLRNSTGRFGANKGDATGIEGAMTTRAFGGLADLWGATLSGTTIKTTEFGVDVAFSEAAPSTTVMVDFIRMRLRYAQ